MGIRYLNHAAVIKCNHGGTVQLLPPPRRSHYIEGHPILTDMDLMKAFIVGCPQAGPGLKPCTKITSILTGRALQIKADGETPLLMTLQAMTDGNAPGMCTALTDGNSNGETLGLPQVLLSIDVAPAERRRPWWLSILIALAKAVVYLGAALLVTYLAAAIVFALFTWFGVAVAFTAVLAGVVVALAVAFILYEMYTRVQAYRAEHGRFPSGSDELWLFAISLLSIIGVPQIIEAWRGNRFFSDEQMPEQDRWDLGVGGALQLTLVAAGFVGRIRGAGPPRAGGPRIFERLNNRIESTIKRWFKPAESALVKRQGPKGVDPKHHNANVTVRGPDGSMQSHQRVVSGKMTPAEKALRFPRGQLASHTEARAVIRTPLKRGEVMTITGQRPPCPSCKGAMNKAAQESGATIKYQWREGGRTRRWYARPKQ